MSAITAVILVGNGHANDGGMRAFAEVNLNEGSRPSIEIQYDKARKLNGNVISNKFSIIPTAENLIDDVIFFVAYAVCNHPKIIEVLETFSDDIIAERERLEMNSDFTNEQRQTIYDQLKMLDDLPKLAFCLFEGSSLMNSITHIAKYQIECEVLNSTFQRQYSAWDQKWLTTGTLL